MRESQHFTEEIAKGHSWLSIAKANVSIVPRPNRILRHPNWHSFGRDPSRMHYSHHRISEQKKESIQSLHGHFQNFWVTNVCILSVLSWYSYAIVRIQAIASEWIQTLHSKMGRINKAEQAQMLQKQKDKFWKIGSINTHFSGVTSPAQPSFAQYTHNRGDNSSDPGMAAYDGYQDSVLNSEQSKPSKHKHKSHKLKFGHHSKDKKFKKHKRKAQSNAFFGNNSKKYLKNRNSKKG